MIELDQLLNEECSTVEIAEFFKKGEFHEEYYLVSAIKRHLRTPEQKAKMYNFDFSIEDMLNGRLEGDIPNEAAQQIFDEWNKKLGFKHFGY